MPIPDNSPEGRSPRPRQFCTGGPIQQDIHYCVPPLDRLDLPAIVNLIEDRKYFVMHAPRQTGKTTCLWTLMDYLNKTGRYRAAYIDVEGAQTTRNDVESGLRSIVNNLADAVEAWTGDKVLRKSYSGVLRGAPPHDLLRQALKMWCERDPRPVCLVIDEVDTLSGETLITLLRQLRSGYADRPRRFPQSVILCGVRDVRDYRIHGINEIVTGGSAFNIKVESLRLGDFTPEEVRRLYGEHTKATGQQFEEDVFPLVWDLTRGQPWLVNALAYQVCFRSGEAQDRSLPVTAAMFHRAKETLILRRDTHVDQLSDKLSEERVRRVIQPIISSSDTDVAAHSDDIDYVIDLGLIRREGSKVEIANAIYREVIPRQLSYYTQIDFAHQQETVWYQRPDGSLDMDKLMRGFQQFFRENGEIWLERFTYKEAGPHLLMQAYLQRLVNGGGRIDREYGLGRRRTDLRVVWNYPGGEQTAVIEIKIQRGSRDKTIEEGLKQTAAYMDATGTVEGHLVIFNRNPKATWRGRIYRKSMRKAKHRITVWGL